MPLAFRTDIEGLRAVAVCAVLLAHSGIGIGEGGFVGVDVFYVISGFLITGLLLREADRRGSISLPAFYARRARRLLPAAALVIVCVLAASLVLLSPTRTEIATGDAVAASLYYLNWRFVAQSADYFGPQTDQSPLQHYWSLSIEEQFYLVWPLVLLGLVVLWRRRGKPMPRAAAAGAIGAITAASLTFSILYEPTSSGEAYFSSFTRAWELGLGGLLVFLPVSRLGRSPAAALGLAGIGAIALATFTFDAFDAVPGGGRTLALPRRRGDHPRGTPRHAVQAADAATGPLHRPKISYPSICGTGHRWCSFAAEVGELSGAEGAALILASFIPAILTHHFVEQPTHHSRRLKARPARSLALGAACTLAGLAAAWGVATAETDFETASARDATGAKSKREPIQETAKAIRPNPLEAAATRVASRTRAASSTGPSSSRPSARMGPTMRPRTSSCSATRTRSTTSRRSSASERVGTGASPG